MQKDTIETIVRRFNEAGVRYLIAGGFAVIAHGYARLTMDLDLVLDLSAENLSKALEILKDEGYTPTIPVPIEQFADEDTRHEWAENRNMVAFPLWSERHRMTNVDLFVREPFDFNRAFETKFQTTITSDLIANFVSFDDLVALKKGANRPKDLQDVYYLQNVKKP